MQHRYYEKRIPKNIHLNIGDKLLDIRFIILRKTLISTQLFKINSYLIEAQLSLLIFTSFEVMFKILFQGNVDRTRNVFQFVLVFYLQNGSLIF